jgi:urocanate hydratase
VDPARIERRLKTRYLDEREDSLDRAIDRALAAKEKGRAISIAVRANAVELLERLNERGVVPDLVTDQTSAHDELEGYVPRAEAGEMLEDLVRLRGSDPKRYIARSYATMAGHVRALLEMRRRGAVVFDYGNNLRGQAKKAGVEDASRSRLCAPTCGLFCEGKGPFRCRPRAIRRISSRRTARSWSSSREPRSRGWLTLAEERVAFQGLPARICWLGYGERSRAFASQRAGSRRQGEGPDRDRPRPPRRRLGGLANRETEAMRDGSDAIADWPILNALLNTACGAAGSPFTTEAASGSATRSTRAWSWSLTAPARPPLERVLTADPGTGVMRHADAGYPEATSAARSRGVDIPMLTELP